MVSNKKPSKKRVQKKRPTSKKKAGPKPRKEPPQVEVTVEGKTSLDPEIVEAIIATNADAVREYIQSASLETLTEIFSVKPSKPDKPVDPPPVVEFPVEINPSPAEDWNLARRIIWVRQRVKRLGKDSTVSTGRGGSYKAVTHDKVTAFLRPKLDEAGILVTTSCAEWKLEKTGAKLVSNGADKMRMEATYHVVFANAYQPDDRIRLIIPALAEDSGDKHPGKAMSYATKYALLKTFMVETGEDDEERDEPDEGTVKGNIGDNENIQADVFALADELYGDDADKKLKAMAKRRFFVDDYRQIPVARLDDVFRALRSNKAREDKEREERK